MVSEASEGQGVAKDRASEWTKDAGSEWRNRAKWGAERYDRRPNGVRMTEGTKWARWAGSDGGPAKARGECGECRRPGPRWPGPARQGERPKGTWGDGGEGGKRGASEPTVERGSEPGQNSLRRAPRERRRNERGPEGKGNEVKNDRSEWWGELTAARGIVHEGFNQLWS